MPLTSLLRVIAVVIVIVNHIQSLLKLEIASFQSILVNKRVVIYASFTDQTLGAMFRSVFTLCGADIWAMHQRDLYGWLLQRVFRVTFISSLHPISCPCIPHRHPNRNRGNHAWPFRVPPPFHKDHIWLLTLAPSFACSRDVTLSILGRSSTTFCSAVMPRLWKAANVVEMTCLDLLEFAFLTAAAATTAAKNLWYPIHCWMP